MSELPNTGVWPAPGGPNPEDWPSVPGYELLAELGRGGMGVVYRARQLGTGRPVALKLIRDGALAGPQARARFRIEADAAARLNHPNVVALYEVGEHAGRAFLAMELVEGGSLDRYLAGRPRPATEAATLTLTLTRAVAHAHDNNIVHRDLKPANVLLSEQRDGVMTLAKIADFGLAKRLDSDSTALTHDGVVLGTPCYMAPEQAAGRASEVGPATDLFALGAMLYELLTGRPPFLAETRDQIIQQVIRDEPVPPSRLRPDVPPDLETVCLKCLEKEPARRYASANDLAADLERFLGGHPVTAVPLTGYERLVRRAARDGYHTLVEVGRGPRSTVYRARTDPLGQPVAVKVFAAGSATREEWEARVRRGAEQTARLTHPLVVGVQKAGWWDGSPYVVSEYVANGSLATHSAGTPGRVREAVRLVERLADLVCYLHRQGVVHGNLKPANVLMAADGIPRLTDFHATGGLFQSRRFAELDDPAGLGHVAPELVRDPAAEPRPYSDVYGLGLILYELLTGRPPFAAATAGELREQVLWREPDPPSRVNPEVTPQLEYTCLVCLRKNHWMRFTRAYDLLTRLRRFLGESAGHGAPGPRRPPGRSDLG